MNHRNQTVLLAIVASLMLLGGCISQPRPLEPEPDSAAQPPPRIGTMPAPGGAPLGPPVPESGNVEILPAATREVVPVTADTGLAQQVEITDVDGDLAFVDVALEDGVRAVAFEWIMLVSPEQRQQLDSEAAALMAFLSNVQTFAITNGLLLIFSVPPDLDANDAILQLVPADMRELIDRNHIYTGQADLGSVSATDPLPLSMPKACDAPLALGVIDSAIDLQHPAFAHLADQRDKRLQQRSFVEAKLVQPAAHGTAVASVLIGANTDPRAGDALRPLLPNAKLYNAAVFHASEGDYQGATALRVLNALDWLGNESEVQVINVSLTGPPNRLLEQAIAAIQQRGKLIVAATGNDGPDGPVRYPAGYEGVVGVTAVARDRSIFPFANQGAQVDFAAPGVDITAALDGGTFGPASGTSIAAPVVAALAACALADDADPVAALKILDAHAEDLGEPGPDLIYGKGLLHP